MLRHDITVAIPTPSGASLHIQIIPYKSPPKLRRQHISELKNIKLSVANGQISVDGQHRLVLDDRRGCHGLRLKSDSLKQLPFCIYDVSGSRGWQQPNAFIPTIRSLHCTRTKDVGNVIQVQEVINLIITCGYHKPYSAPTQRRRENKSIRRTHSPKQTCQKPKTLRDQKSPKGKRPESPLEPLPTTPPKRNAD